MGLARPFKTFELASKHKISQAGRLSQILQLNRKFFEVKNGTESVRFMRSAFSSS